MRLLLTTTALLISLGANAALAQSKPGAKPDKPHDAAAKDKGQWKAKPNHWNASAATKEMLIKHGYKVLGAEQFPDGNVIYFRREGGNSVQSIGDIERVVIRPDGDTVAIEGAPRAVLADVKAKLGL